MVMPTYCTLKVAATPCWHTAHPWTDGIVNRAMGTNWAKPRLTR
jgi:hypothetical protein